MERKETELKSIRPFIDTVVEFLIESMPLENLPQTDAITEADFYASLIESSGVPREVLILERESTNSLENVLLGMATCHNIKFDPSSLILCAMPPLLKRSCATFRKQFPNIMVYGSAFPMPKEWFTPSRIIRLLGELERLEEYAKKGDMLPVEIPAEVASAAEKVRQSVLQ